MATTIVISHQYPTIFPLFSNIDFRSCEVFCEDVRQHHKGTISTLFAMAMMENINEVKKKYIKITKRTSARQENQFENDTNTIQKGLKFFSGTSVL